MLNGIRRFAVTSTNRQRHLVSSPYSKDRPGGVVTGEAKTPFKMREILANTSNGGWGGGMGLNSGTSSAQTVVGKNIIADLLEGFIPPNPQIKNRIFRDIYYHDAICGAAVDLLSEMPWSDFYLTGIKDYKVLDTYHKSVENMRLKVLLPGLSREYMVIGQFIGTSVYDPDQGAFSAVVPQNADFTEIIPLPIAGMDPIINIKMPDNIRSIFKSNSDPRIAEVMRNLPEHVRQGFSDQEVRLDPSNTLYIPRRTLLSAPMGTSYYERVLPIFLMEKALWRGSIDTTYRRQRPLLHIMVGGDGDDYVPTIGDMEKQRDVWMEADADPTGAIIVTPTGIQPNELRDPSAGLRIDESFDVYAAEKYRALGISEQALCLTGDSYIQTNRGLYKIKDIIDTKYRKIKKNTPTTPSTKLSPLLANSEYTPNTIGKWVYSGYKNIVRVTTKLHYKLEGTKEHKLFMLSDDYTIVEKRIEELKKDNLICLPTNTMTRNEPLSLAYKLELTKHRQVGIKYPTHMTPKLAFILACIVSDGYVAPKKYRIGFTNTNEVLLNTYCDYVEEIFGIRPKISKGRLHKSIIKQKVVESTKLCYDAKLNNKSLFYVFTNLGLYVKKGRKKTPSNYVHIPWSIMRADAASQLSFIAGYIEGDGCFHKDSNRIGIYSRSKKLKHEMQIMLASHGIISHDRNNKITLSVNNYFSEKLKHLIKPYMVAKDIIINKTVFNKNNFGVPTKNLISWLGNRELMTNKNGTLFKADNGQTFIPNFKNYCRRLSNCLYYDNYKKGMYNNLLNSLRKISPDMYGRLIALLENPQQFYFDPIKTIIQNKAKEPTYDLMMTNSGNHSYVANGMLVHNSGESSYTIADAAFTIFVENVRTYRSMITQELFYYKIFPAIALAHEFTRDRYQVLGRTERRNRRQNYPHIMSAAGMPFAVCADDRHGFNINHKNIDTSNLAMPRVQWQKHLKPEGDAEFLNLLQTAAQAGLPVPISMMAVAAGIDLMAILNNEGEEARTRKRLKQYMERMEKYQIAGEQAGQDEDGNMGPDDGGDNQATARAMRTIASGFSTNRVGLKSRQFDERLLPHNRDKNGKYRTSSSRYKKELREAIDREVARAFSRHADREKRQRKASKKENSRVIVHPQYGIIK